MSNAVADIERRADDAVVADDGSCEGMSGPFFAKRAIWLTSDFGVARGIIVTSPTLQRSGTPGSLISIPDARTFGFPSGTESPKSHG
jgi:hypothetical protein